MKTIKNMESKKGKNKETNKEEKRIESKKKKDKQD